MNFSLNSIALVSIFLFSTGAHGTTTRWCFGPLNPQELKFIYQTSGRNRVQVEYQDVLIFDNMPATHPWTKVMEPYEERLYSEVVGYGTCASADADELNRTVLKFELQSKQILIAQCPVYQYGWSSAVKKSDLPIIGSDQKDTCTNSY